MEELLKINEEYLAKLKYDPSSKYYGWSMASIFGDIFANCESMASRGYWEDEGDSP